MKKFLLLTSGVLLLGVWPVNALTPTRTLTPILTPTAATPSAKISPTGVGEQVIKLREKVAERVSELKKKNHRPFAGNITQLSDNTFTVMNAKNETREVKIDSTITTLYKIAGVNLNEITKKDLAKGDYVIVTGPLLEKTITANLIYVDETFIVSSGKITDVDTENFFIKVLTTDKTAYSLDIERSTQIQLLDIKTLESAKIGFTKLKVGDYVHFVAIPPSKKDVMRVSAKKLLVLPQEYFNK